MQMSSHKGVSRTLLDEFNQIPQSDTPNQSKEKKTTKRSEESEGEDEEEYTPSYPKRDYETRNRQKGHSAPRQEAETAKSSLKPRQENSLGELTKKFIQLIKQSEDYCIDLNDAVGELNVQK